MYQGPLSALVLKWSEVNITNTNFFNAEQVRILKSLMVVAASTIGRDICQWCLGNLKTRSAIGIVSARPRFES